MPGQRAGPGLTSSAQGTRFRANWGQSGGRDPPTSAVTGSGFKPLYRYTPRPWEHSSESHRCSPSATWVSPVNTMDVSASQSGSTTGAAYGFVTRDDIEIHLGLVPADSWAGPSSAYLWVEDADGWHRRGVPSGPMSAFLKTPSGDSTRVLSSTPTETSFDSDRRSETPAPGDDRTHNGWNPGFDGTTRWQPTKTRGVQCRVCRSRHQVAPRPRTRS